MLTRLAALAALLLALAGCRASFTDLRSPPRADAAPADAGATRDGRSPDARRGDGPAASDATGDAP